ncbi:glyoxalase-like protein [Neolewinella xylanilytica]|uniref:Glyoxalase-like protein n=1 Tax=Neolewinella xylanilytica TaxID=1514080 RepID=A0A2S6I1B3_9BACT|nr:VOC family protein [Neolewinella xylanilytica]PPK84663.1 glyoxalase-like protein [Neolewinella xylanilytica]
MLDHLVYLVPDLPAAVTRFTALGYPPSPGGRHLSRGTYNALLRLGNRQYLELLAVDPVTDIPPPRWMGVDRTTKSRISRWAASAGAIHDGRPVVSGSRELPGGTTLRWTLTDPGTDPPVAVLPFLIDWGTDGLHPADGLPDLGLQLGALRLYHPAPDGINAELAALGLPQKVIRGPAPKIEAVIRGPKGEFTL